MRELITRIDEERRALPSRFEPVGGEVFLVDAFPDREFGVLAVGAVRGEDGCFCDRCALRREVEGRRLCVRGKVVCRSYERKDGRQIVVVPRPALPWLERKKKRDRD